MEKTKFILHQKLKTELKSFGSKWPQSNLALQSKASRSFLTLLEQRHNFPKFLKMYSPSAPTSLKKVKFNTWKMALRIMNDLLCSSYLNKTFHFFTGGAWCLRKLHTKAVQSFTIVRRSSTAPSCTLIRNNLHHNSTHDFRVTLRSV